MIHSAEGGVAVCNRGVAPAAPFLSPRCAIYLVSLGASLQWAAAAPVHGLFGSCHLALSVGGTLANRNCNNVCVAMPNLRVIRSERSAEARVLKLSSLSLCTIRFNVNKTIPYGYR